MNDELNTRAPAQPEPSNKNTGHGHVRPRPDGVRARCGGPGVCKECSREKAAMSQPEPAAPMPDTFMGEPVLTRWKPLNRDDSRLALHQSMHNRSFGNPSDDKLMLEWLWENGYALCKRVPDEAAPTEATLDQMAGKAWDRFQRHTAELQALENCRLYAARHRKEDWAATILRFCADGGATGSPLREAAPTVVEPVGIDAFDLRGKYGPLPETGWDEAPKKPSKVGTETVALEPVYETIIHWDEGGGKRSRRELARRIVALYTTPPRAALTDERPYTYASTQATNCAGCGEYKHTPLRIDAMDGYVCLTCIDKKLGTLLGEFGCPAPQSPLSEEDITSEYFASQLTTKDSVESVFAAGVRWAEKAHGIAHGIAADRGEK